MEKTITLKDLLKRWKKEAGAEKYRSLASYRGNCLIICTNHPELYIGRNGALYEKYFQMIKNGETNAGEMITRSPFEVGELEKIEFVETFYKLLGRNNDD